jgi:hypothetical protein
MGARVNGAFGLILAGAVAAACAGRSQRSEGDDGGEGANDGAAGSGGVAGTSTSAGGNTGVAGSTVGTTGGTISTGGGAIGAGGNAGVPIGGTSGMPGVAGSAAGGGSAGAPPLGEPTWFVSGSLPLSKRAFQRTVAQLLGLAPDETLPRERLRLVPSIDANVDAPQNVELTEIARREVNAMDELALRDVLGCVDFSRACGEKIATDFAPRAFRRPLTQRESEVVLEVFDAVVSASPLKETVIAVLSLAPAQWLRAVGTRDELGAFRLDDYEMASILSYGLTGLSPDEQLRAVAAAGELRDPLRRREEAERLLATFEGLETYTDFIGDWFRIKEPEDFWFYDQNPGLADAMELETALFIETATFDEAAPVSELLSAPWSILSATLIEHYGITTSDASARVDLSATRRRGVLHHGSFLASHSYQEQGGLIARSVATLKLLCEKVPEPPVEVPPIPPPEPGRTYRDRLSQATASAACQGCHSSLDPVAFSFGKFDGYGAFVELDEGVPIDAAGTVQTFDGSTFSFVDSADLAEQIGVHPRFTECFNRNLVGAFVGEAIDHPAMTDYVERFAADGAVRSMVESVLAWVESEHFVRRHPELLP